MKTKEKVRVEMERLKDRETDLSHKIKGKLGEGDCLNRNNCLMTCFLLRRERRSESGERREKEERGERRRWIGRRGRRRGKLRSEVRGERRGGRE